jgi:hypothetical protein
LATDSDGGRSQAAHQTAKEIFLRAWAVPTTALAVLAELFHDGMTSLPGPTHDVLYWRFTELPRHAGELGMAEDENG